MADRPILFSGPMVRAIIEGRKTQTRRVMKPQPYFDDRGQLWWMWSKSQGCACNDPVGAVSDEWFKHIPYAIGDRLWVREAWRAAMQFDATKPSDIPQSALIVPEASADIHLGGKMRPSMFMPRWASRLTLIVTDVRVQRLQEISQTDAIAEGAPPSHPSIDRISSEYGFPDFSRSWFAQLLWDSHAKPGATWADNPWIAAITFETHHCNIDAMEGRNG